MDCIRHISKTGSYVHHTQNIHLSYRISVPHLRIVPSSVLGFDVTAVMQQLLIRFSALIHLSILQPH